MLLGTEINLLALYFLKCLKNSEKQVLYNVLAEQDCEAKEPPAGPDGGVSDMVVHTECIPVAELEDEV